MRRRWMRGGPLLTVYASQEGHASLEKSMVLLGMGRHQLRRIPVADDFTIDLQALEKRITEDREQGHHPICVVGNAGTTNTGAVDPLNALADVCRTQELWFHVDAAYGGPAATTEAAGELFRGLERADSVVVNPHKWLFVPAEAACILVRDPEALRDTFKIAAEYFREEDDARWEGPLDFKDYGPQLSKSFRALKVWMTFKAYGARKLRAAIESNIEIMRYLADQIDESDDFVRLAPVPLSIVCFQYRTPMRPSRESAILDDLNNRLLEALEKTVACSSRNDIRGRKGASAVQREPPFAPRARGLFASRHPRNRPFIDWQTDVNVTSTRTRFAGCELRHDRGRRRRAREYAGRSRTGAVSRSGQLGAPVSLDDPRRTRRSQGSGHHGGRSRSRREHRS